MNYDYPQTDVSRSVLGGLFAGIIGTLANVIFVAVYRSLTEFYEFNGLDITVIVFGTLLQLITCGIIFYFFVHYMKYGVSVYRTVVLVITAALIFAGIALRQSFIGDAPEEFRFMVIGTQVIIGGLAAFLIPYLFRHDSIIS